MVLKCYQTQTNKVFDNLYKIVFNNLMHFLIDVYTIIDSAIEMRVQTSNKIKF